MGKLTHVKSSSRSGGAFEHRICRRGDAANYHEPQRFPNGAQGRQVGDGRRTKHEAGHDSRHVAKGDSAAKRSSSPRRWIREP
jgi:hypothetical protein